VHLVTVRNNWQTVHGTVESCRYLQGTPGVHEVFVRFDRAIDPATFAVAASRARILVVDDSLVSQKLCACLLETMNVQLTCASNGLEAVERALADTFDMILMDIEMPELDGLSAVRMLRSKGYLRTIVAVSASTDPEDQRRCLDAGCDDFLGKPVTREALAEIVNRNKPEPLVSALLDEPGMTDLFDQFVDSLPASIAALEAAFGDENYDDLARETRRLKGEAGGIGFEPISEAAANVEEVVKHQAERPEIATKLGQLIRLCLAARPATNRPVKKA